MDDVTEKRVFDDRAGGEELIVAAGDGVLSVAVSADRVGRFAVVHRCAPADAASDAGRVAVAAEADVLHRDPGGEAFATTGFGSAVAVGFADGRLVAAGPDGRVARRDPTDGGDAWADLGRIDGEVRAIDGRLLAASDGVHRLPGLDYAGLEDVHDVAAEGPLAATGSGLYSLGNGWMAERDGDFRAAASDGPRAHAATAETLFERRGARWEDVELPADGQVVAVAYGTVPYAVTADGVLLAGGEEGWRGHLLGVEGVVACVVA